MPLQFLRSNVRQYHFQRFVSTVNQHGRSNAAASDLPADMLQLIADINNDQRQLVSTNCSNGREPEIHSCNITTIRFLCILEVKETDIYELTGKRREKCTEVYQMQTNSLGLYFLRVFKH